jgi:hypothetical protein
MAVVTHWLASSDTRARMAVCGAFPEDASEPIICVTRLHHIRDVKVMQSTLGCFTDDKITSLVIRTSD